MRYYILMLTEDREELKLIFANNEQDANEQAEKLALLVGASGYRLIQPR